MITWLKKSDCVVIAVSGLSISEILSSLNQWLQTGILLITFVTLLLKFLKSNRDEPPKGDDVAELADGH